MEYKAVTPENVESLSVRDKVIAENIPQELKALKRWSVWMPVRAKGNPNKINKVPSQKNGSPCDWTNPEFLMSFDEAYKALEDNTKFGGVQFSIYDSDDYIGFDYDQCTDQDGNILSKVLEDFEKLGCPYAEFSPSAKGIRFFLYGWLPKNYKVEGKPEIYCMKKPLTVTGRKLEKASSIIISNDKALEDVVKSYYPESLKEKNTKRTSIAYSDEEILIKMEKQKNGSELMKAYEGEDICNDRSATDYKVISAIAFYTQDIAQIYRLFEKSGLVRSEKCSRRYAPVQGWEEEVEKAGIPQNYITLTICNAIDRLSSVYGVQETELYCKFRNYTVNSSGVTVTKQVTRKNKETGKPEIVDEDARLTSTVVYVSAFGYNEKDQKYYAQIKIKNPHNKFITKWIEPEQLTIKKNLLNLANQISMTDFEAPALTEFFKVSIDEVRNTQEKPVEVYSATGYQENNTCFVLGNRKITAEGIEEIVPVDMPLASKLTKNGTLEGYAKAGRVLMQFDALRMKAYALHASVLLPLVFHKNVTVTHTAISGNLKGQSSYWLMGAYGHPKLLQTNPTSTEKGIQTHMMISQSLPTSIEELTGKSKVLKDLQYSTTTGVSRETLTRSSTLKGGEEITGIVVVNAEYSLFTQNDRLGNKVRNFDIDEVIPYLESQIRIDMENAIQDNYGHAAETLIQCILKEKADLLSMMKAFEQALPDVGNDIPKSRFKEMCTFFALSGYFVEKMFQKLGIPNKDPIKIVSYFMKRNLGSGLTKSLFESALPSIAEYFIKNMVSFETPEPGEREPAQRKGYIEKNALCFLPDDLEKFLNTAYGEGQGKVILQDLKKNDCLITKDKNNPSKLKEAHKEAKKGINLQVYKIKKEAFKTYANLDLDSTEQSNDEEVNTEIPEAKKPEISVKIEEPKVTTEINEDLFQEA